MKKLQFLLAILLSGAGLYAQKSLAVFLDGSDKKPFYLRMGSRLTPSGEAGQVVLSSLTGSVYEIIVGFPGEDSTEYKFQVALKNEENSYRLAAAGEGWTMVDPATSLVIKGARQPVSKKPVTSTADTGTQPVLNTGATGAGSKVEPVSNPVNHGGGSASSADPFSGMIRKTDAFSVMMAGVVNDTAVLYTIPAPLVSAEPKTKDVVAGSTPVAAKKDSAGSFGVKNPGGAKPIDSALAAAERKESEAGTTTAIDVAKADTLSESVAVKAVDSISTAISEKTEKTAKDAIAENKNDSLLKSQQEKSAQAGKEAEMLKPLNDTMAASVKSIDSGSVDKKLTGNTPVTEMKADNTNPKMPARSDSAVSMVTKPETVVIRDSGTKKPGISFKNAVSGVQKLFERKTDKEVIMNYSDKNPDGKTDTINITIPVEADTARSQPAAAKSGSSFGKWQSNPRPLSDGTAKQPEVAAKPVENVATEAGNNAGAEKPKGLVMVNSDCSNFATAYDVDKLKTRMAAEKSPDERIVLAKKVFKTKCFTTSQVATLSELFTGDEGRYKFLDTAYPFVSDSQEFRKLVELLKEEYYVKRFNAMIRS